MPELARLRQIARPVVGLERVLRQIGVLAQTLMQALLVEGFEEAHGVSDFGFGFTNATEDGLGAGDVVLCASGGVGV